MKNLCFHLVFLSIFTSLAQAELDFSGYVDMEYISRFGDKPQEDPEFDQHHISLIFQHETDRFKLLTELEWEHATNISATDGGNATGDGKVVVERAWGNIDLSKYFKIKLGVILNSTIYQQNHYPSIVVNYSRPQMVKKVFDGSYEGIKFYGNLPKNFNYDLWLTRDPKQTNGGVAATEHGSASVGGRLGYEKRYSNKLRVNTGLLWANYKVSSSADSFDHVQKAIGLEAEVNYCNFTLWSEYGERTDDNPNLSSRRGFYSILSYSFYKNNEEWAPFVMFDRYKDSSSSLEYIDRTGLGLSYRPVPTIALKSEYLKTNSYNATSTSKVLQAEQIGLAFVYFFN